MNWLAQFYLQQSKEHKRLTNREVYCKRAYQWKDNYPFGEYRWCLSHEDGACYLIWTFVHE